MHVEAMKPKVVIWVELPSSTWPIATTLSASQVVSIFCMDLISVLGGRRRKILLSRIWYLSGVCHFDTAVQVRYVWVISPCVAVHIRPQTCPNSLSHVQLDITSYFYGDLEAKTMSFLNSQGDSSLLMRLVDDFLLLTNKRSVAIQFLKLMHKVRPTRNGRGMFGPCLLYRAEPAGW